jgi:two-component system sensor histidine kinase FlrB
MLRFSGEIRPRMEYGCINDILRDTCVEFRGLLAGGGIEIVLESEDSFMLYLDKDLIRQAFINIMLNAVQAMPDGGKVRVNIRSGADDDLRQMPVEVLVSIKDSGSGMDGETKARLFEPFYSTKDRGTGLGMSITLSIISAHKGRIEVDSFPGRGTEFIIALPTEKRIDQR